MLYLQVPAAYFLCWVSILLIELCWGQEERETSDCHSFNNRFNENWDKKIVWQQNESSLISLNKKKGPFSDTALNMQNWHFSLKKTSVKPRGGQSAGVVLSFVNHKLLACITCYSWLEKRLVGCLGVVGWGCQTDFSWRKKSESAADKRGHPITCL